MKKLHGFVRHAVAIVVLFNGPMGSNLPVIDIAINTELLTERSGEVSILSETIPLNVDSKSTNSFLLEKFQEKPVPVAKPVVSSAVYTIESPAHLATLFTTYAQAFGTDEQLLIRISKCESHHNPAAVSSSGKYVGLYQFSASTWESTRNAMGEDPNPELRTNPEEAIKTASWKIAHGGRGAWPHCGR